MFEVFKSLDLIGDASMQDKSTSKHQRSLPPRAQGQETSRNHLISAHEAELTSTKDVLEFYPQSPRILSGDNRGWI